MAKETLAKDRANFINYATTVLDNGLKIIHHKHQQSSLCAVSLLISAGSKNDYPGLSGLAHLFEHLMYAGTPHVKDYDHWLQRAGGDGNAFTSQDVTCFYATIPVQNLAPYLRLEADRLKNLKLTTQLLRTERHVVIEEYNETVLDEPFGDALHLILAHMYPPGHPYSWPAIGINLDSLRAIHKTDLERFYLDFYHPNNASLALATLALVAALAAGFVPVRHAGARAAWAALLTLAGIAYAQFLHAANLVSIALGAPVRDTLASIGTEMAFALSLARLSRVGAIAIALAPVVAALLAWRAARRA